MNVSLWGAFNKVADTLFPANYDKHPLIRYLKERKLNKTMSEEELKVVDDDARKKTTEIESLEDYFSEDNVRKRQLEDDLANLGDDIADIEDEMRKAEDKQDLQELERLRTELAEAKEERERIKQEIAEIERRQKADKDQVLEEATIASLINSMDLEKNANVVDSLYFDYPDKDLGDHITVFDDRDTTGWVDYVVGDEMLSVYNQDNKRVMLHTNIKNRTTEEIEALKAETLADVRDGVIVVMDYDFANKKPHYKFIIDTNEDPPKIIAEPPISKMGKGLDDLKDMINGSLKDPNNQVARAFAANRFGMSVNDPQFTDDKQNQWADELLSGAEIINRETEINTDIDNNENPFEDEPPIVEEPPVVLEEPPVVLEEAPVVEEPPVVEAPVAEEPPIVEAPVIEEAPVEETPVVETPVVEEPSKAPKGLAKSDRDAIHKIQAKDDFSFGDAEIIYKSGIKYNKNANFAEKVKTLLKDKSLPPEEKIAAISIIAKKPALTPEDAVQIAKKSIQCDEINKKISEINTGDGIRDSLELTRLIKEQKALRNEIKALIGEPLKGQGGPSPSVILDAPGLGK